MDFAWSDSERELHERTLRFARAQLAQEPAGDHRRFPRDDWRRCGEFGLTGLCVPERYHGLGLGALGTANAFEAFGEGCQDMGLVFAVGAHLFACLMPIVEHASEALKERLLPRLATGQAVGANAITEAEAGSDVFALRMSARRDNDDFILDGVKSYVTNGPEADVFVVYASTRPEHGHLGISAFIVEKGAPGLRVGEPFHKMGLNSASIASLYLDGCRVPAANMLGAEGARAGVFTDSMHWERACLFAGYVGAMERQLAACVAYAKERKQFGRSIGKHQAVAHRIADMKLRLESARLLLYRACWLLDRGEKATAEVACAKLAISEAAIASGLDAIQIHGGAGYLVEVGIERGLRDAIPSAIFSGTSEIQRNLIAAKLGL